MSACARVPVVKPSAMDAVVSGVRRPAVCIGGYYSGCISQAAIYHGTSDGRAVLGYG